MLKGSVGMLPVLSGILAGQPEFALKTNFEL